MRKKFRFSKNSITWKIVMLLILFIAPFNLAALYTASTSIGNACRQTEMTMESLVRLTAQQLDNRIEAANNFLSSLLKERDDFKIFSEREIRDGTYYRAETSLASYLNSNAKNGVTTDGYFWYRPEEGTSFAGLTDLSGVNSMKAVQVKTELIDWLKEERGKGYARWRLIELGGMKWLIRVCVTGDIYYGGLFSLDASEEELLKSAAFSDMEVHFLEGTGSAETGRKKLSVSCAPEKANLLIQLVVPKSEAYFRLPWIQLLCIVLMIFYVLLIQVLILNLDRLVVQPLKAIRDAMILLKGGDQDYRIPYRKASEEFLVIDETFNDMADRLKTLKIENYEKELARQRMELRNLQLQIRPHFLMNMFNLLYSFAQIENYQSIQKLALYLSDYFRHIFQNGKDFQPFEREFMLIQKYLEISELRYPDWFEVVYDVDPEALEVEVPPLLIHNFVENIFKHVMNYEQKLHIRLEAYVDGEEAVFTVSDDGPGMAPEMVENINNGVFPHEKEGRIHVGIANSYRRIHYFYGDRGKLSVESMPGEGTCFQIIIPREADDELTDCG